MRQTYGLKRTASLLASLTLLAAIAVTTPACDLISGGDDGIEGVWASRGDDVVFLNITSDMLTIYDYMGDDFDEGDNCYEVTPMTIRGHDGDNYTVVIPIFNEEFTMTMKVDGDKLTVTMFGETETLDRSDRKVSSFTPQCTG